MARRLFSTGSAYEPLIGCSRAVRSGDLLSISATAPLAPDGRTTAARDAYGQARRALEIIAGVVSEAGFALGEVVKTRVYFRSYDDWEALARAHGEVFGAIRPACAFIQVVGFASPEWLVEIEADCHRGTADALQARREAVILRHIDAENRGDLDGMIATFHRPRYDVVPMGTVSEGEAAVRDLVRGLVTAFPDFRFTPTAIHHTDAAVVVEAHMTGTHRAPWAGIEPRGGRMDLRAACVFDFEGDRLVNETVYFDFGALQRQLA